jgi:hypothetical protein
MSFHQINSKVTIEVFYLNEYKCSNYNDFHGFDTKSKNYKKPGYYYENMIGPFETMQEAISHAISN